LCSDTQNNPSANFRKLLQERLDKANPRDEITSEETKRLRKLETIAARLTRGENAFGFDESILTGEMIQAREQLEEIIQK